MIGLGMFSVLRLALIDFGRAQLIWTEDDASFFLSWLSLVNELATPFSTQPRVHSTEAWHSDSLHADNEKPNSGEPKRRGGGNWTKRHGSLVSRDTVS